ncbi:hypothetical protein M3Y94_00916500 [Aphelenchoides besseyi]|nr:hypothetical protein M3Y94_00916500 [Aphelenchoides besseyi]KAI6223229.1 hypothetical protein M3Y95_00867400 [Aphelenchoides besseyi]
MSYDCGTTEEIEWAIETLGSTYDLRSEDYELENCGGVKVQLYLRKGSYTFTNEFRLSICDFKNLTQIRLQVRPFLKDSSRRTLFLLNTTEWSDVKTLDPSNPTASFVYCTNLKDWSNLTLYVEVRKVVDGPFTVALPQADLLSLLETAFEKEEYSDVEIHVRNERVFMVNKLLLQIHSDVFKAMFSHNLQEKGTNVIHIDNADEEVVEAMMLFLYSGKVMNIEDVASRLILLADQYQLDSLSVACAKALKTDITVENVVERIRLLKLPENVSNYFKRDVFRFVKKNYMEVSALPEWPDFFTQDFYPILNDLFAFLAIS